jgi:Rieske Fe-S protein
VTSSGAFLPRRRFLKLFAVFTATGVFPGSRQTVNVLAQAAPQPATDEGLLQLRLSDFPALQKPFGSVRLGTSAVDSDHQPIGLFYPVIITRGANGQFYALDSACTHEGCTVPAYDSGLGYMECPCHGSRYFIDGSVKNGPANFPLRQFNVSFDGTDLLTIGLPDISFALQALQVQPKSGRLSIQFIAFDQIEYEIRYRPDAKSPWSLPVPFALTADGPADQTILKLDNPDFATVFLNPTGASGLYGVAMRTKEV